MLIYLKLTTKVTAALLFVIGLVIICRIVYEDPSYHVPSAHHLCKIYCSFICSFSMHVCKTFNLLNVTQTCNKRIFFNDLRGRTTQI